MPTPVPAIARPMTTLMMLLVLGLPALVRGAAPAEEGPDYVDDRAIRAAVEREATAMIEAGDAAANADLQAQLERGTAAITAPAEGELLAEGDDLYDRASDGVLVIAGLYLCGRCEHYHANCATGFVVSGDGLAVTNHHVVANADNVTLVARTRDGRVVPVLEVLASNERDDVALIRLGGDGPFTPLPIAREASVGETVHAITHPDGRFYCYTSGEVSRFFMEPQRDGPSVRRLQVTADYARGSSGGPILNDKGQVVGMVASTTSVYYAEHDGRQENLQMVFHNCVPFESILDLFGGAAQD